MQIATVDITHTTTAVRRHEALLRYARYMLVFNLAIFRKRCTAHTLTVQAGILA